MRLVVRMAAETVRFRQCDCYRLYVAVGALDIGVRAIEREFRITLMVEAHVGPRTDLMAVGALGAIDSVVRIVVFMAVVTLARQGDFELIARVAGLAVDVGVTPGQGKTAALEVIEEAVSPLRRAVAILTLGSIQAHVRVVVFVASDALRCRIDVYLVDVAADTAEAFVCPCQRVTAAELMIVECIGPFGLAMAVDTLCPEIAHVLVVVCMAVIALSSGDIMEWQILRMAVVADWHQVAVAQREISQIVVELLGYEPENVGVPAGMVRMAFGAGRVRVDLRRQ